ncbi:hypothetical protein OROGR_004005 [Orobanche gracilis]
MEEKSEQASPSSNIKQRILCEECKTNSSKYKCPGCSVRSCSLPCVNSHKKRTACTGKKTITSSIPISQFDDNLLISDYNMLEDVKRIADSARRLRVKLCGYGYPQFRLPIFLKKLQKAAASRRTKLQFLSNGMSKRQKNQTCYDNRQKFISWTIEWRFHSTDIVLVDHGVNENTTLSSVIENHLKPGPWNHSLRQFCNHTLDSLKFFIRKNPKGSRSPFRQLNVRAPICEQLSNMVILEYPVIHVYLPSHSYNFLVINDLAQRKIETKEPVCDDSPSTKGVAFKEEEIEDRGDLDPLVSDLMNPANDKRPRTKNEQDELVPPPQVVPIKRAKSLGFGRIEDENVGGKSCIEQLDEIGDFDFDFDFDPDLYPDLFDANADCIFDFDGELAEERDVEDGEFLGEEELEEGEIPQ